MKKSLVTLTKRGNKNTQIYLDNTFFWGGGGGGGG